MAGCPRIGSAHDDKFLPVEAFGLEPEALAWAVTCVQPLGDDAFEPKGTGMSMKCRP